MTNNTPPARRKRMLWYVLGGLAVLALLFLLLRSCGDRDAGEGTTTTTQTNSTTTAATTTPAPTTAPTLGPPERVSLPNGSTIEVPRGGFNWSLQQYLASNEAAGRTFTFDGLHFDSNSAALGAQSQPTIAALGPILQAYPNARVRVEGHTDEVGDAAGNKRLSDERAAAVAQAIIGAGIQPERVTSAGFGEPARRPRTPPVRDGRRTAGRT